LRCRPLGQGVVDTVTNARLHEGKGIGNSLVGEVRQFIQGRVGIGQGWKPSGQHRTERFHAFETAPNQTHALRRRRALRRARMYMAAIFKKRVLLLGNFGLVLDNVGEVDGAGHVANIFCTTKQGQRWKNGQGNCSITHRGSNTLPAPSRSCLLPRCWLSYVLCCLWSEK
jgi:hypothetical protein